MQNHRCPNCGREAEALDAHKLALTGEWICDICGAVMVGVDGPGGSSANQAESRAAAQALRVSTKPMTACHSWLLESKAIGCCAAVCGPAMLAGEGGVGGAKALPASMYRQQAQALLGMLLIMC